jgi:hypothetical protein
VRRWRRRLRRPLRRRRLRCVLVRPDLVFLVFLRRIVDIVDRRNVFVEQLLVVIRIQHVVIEQQQ